MTLNIPFLSALALGAVGGGLGAMIGLPLPFLLGALIASAAYCFWRDLPEAQPSIDFPEPIRASAIALIGTMIGSNFSPDILPLLPQFWPSALTVILYVLSAHIGGIYLLTWVSGYTRADAFYAAMPGGVIEAVQMAEENGADGRIVTVQHFIRIILIIGSVPILFWIFSGQVVGSAAGESLTATRNDVWDYGAIIAVAVIGFWLGKLLHLPAGRLIGPLFLCGIAQLIGLVDFGAPVWLMSIAQWIIGTALGTKFSGINREMLIRALWSSVLHVGFLLSLGMGFAVAMAAVTPATNGTMFISFAAGGVIEMSLIALSINASPLIVTLHHLIRISVTVFLAKALEPRFALGT